MHVFTCVCAHVHVCRPEADTECFLNHSLLYFLRQGPPLNLVHGCRLTGQQVSGTPLFLSPQCCYAVAGF